jgi:TetR/AcrR family transcriptional repressor of bet genes
MPKRVDIQTQRRSIANAAIAVIHESGLDRARLRDVARAANVTTGAVMHYFDGKDAVIEAALEEIVRRTLERMNTAVRPEKKDDLDDFIRRVGNYLPLRNESRAEWRVWLAFWGRAIGDDRLREVHRHYYDKIIDRMASALAPFHARDSRPSMKKLRSQADALLAAIDGIGTRATLEPDLWPPRRQRRTLTALIHPMLMEFAGAARPAPPTHQKRKKGTPR